MVDVCFGNAAGSVHRYTSSDVGVIRIIDHGRWHWSLPWWRGALHLHVGQCRCCTLVRLNVGMLRHALLAESIQLGYICAVSVG